MGPRKGTHKLSRPFSELGVPVLCSIVLAREPVKQQAPGNISPLLDLRECIPRSPVEF